MGKYRYLAPTILTSMATATRLSDFCPTPEQFSSLKESELGAAISGHV
jgi:hypothetical protein